MIKDKRAIPLGKLFAIWLMSGIVVVFLIDAYATAVKLPAEFISDNEVIRLIQGSVLFLAGLWALSTLDIDFKAAISSFDANIKGNLKLTFKYFLVYVLSAAVLIGALSLAAILLMKAGVFTMGTFDTYYANATADKLVQKNYLRDFIIRFPIKFILYLFATCVLIPIEEEIFTRRLLYVSLRHKMGVSLSLVISAIVFGAEHMGTAAGAAVVVGLFLSWIYEKHQNLSVNIMVHGLINFSVTMVMILYAV